MAYSVLSVANIPSWRPFEICLPICTTGLVLQDITWVGVQLFFRTHRSH